MGNFAKFLNDGTMDRRQILQALGVGAGAALAAGVIPKTVAAFAAQGAAAGKSFPVTTMNHLALASADWVKSRAFYVDVFGGRVVWDDGKGCEVVFGPENEPNGIYIRQAGANAKPTIGHFAFGIQNIGPQLAAMKAEMERRGLKNIRPDGEHGWISDDPAGYMLNTWVPVKDPAMFPGAAKPCAVASSPECKAAFEAGHKNLASVPKPSGKGFTATAFSNVVLNIAKADMAKEREFYQNLLGMKVLHESPEHAILKFGPNALVLDATVDPGPKPYCNHFGLQIENYDSAKVEAELKGRGLNPKPYTKLAWTVMDPDGLRVEVAGPGLAELMAKEGVPR